MSSDRQGNTLSGATPAALTLYEQAVEAFNIYRGDPIALVDEAIAQAPDFAMARILKAHLYGLATEPEATAEARDIVAEVKTRALNEREASHLDALDLLLQGNWTAAAVALDHHLVRYPRD
ncbi:MAG TPA: tetratricopeptide repeat protein, partial [Kiloniellaceae bacterium]|nr:tetratricopeptide repeat protein [Kiloniellaceae bacterium]